MKNHLIVLCIFTFSLLTGCASIVDGTTQTIEVDSNPQGATVYVSKRSKDVVGTKVEVGETPITVTIARKDGIIFLQKEGYEEEEVALVRTMNNWMWGNILLTSPLSTSIDTSTGASNEFDPHSYLVEMKPTK